MKQNTIIIEDEPIARAGMEGFVRRIDALQLVGSFQNPLQATEILQNGQVDLMLLDIKTPEMDGISFLKTLSRTPATIITTAYSQYAVDGYGLNVIDYLLKPIAFERLLSAVQKIKPKLPSAADSFVFIKCENRLQKVWFSEILFVKALENYVIIQTEAQRLISHLTLKSVEEFLPASVFAKVHKSYIVSIEKITAIEGHVIHIGNYEIAFNRNNKEEVLALILRDNYLRR